MFRLCVIRKIDSFSVLCRLMISLLNVFVLIGFSLVVGLFRKMIFGFSVSVCVSLVCFFMFFDRFEGYLLLVFYGSLVIDIFNCVSFLCCVFVRFGMVCKGILMFFCMVSVENSVLF